MDYGYGGTTTTSYGAQGGGGGGGFMPGTQGDSGGGAKRSYGKDTLRPVTVKQLLNAHHPNPDAEHFMIDDIETTQVSFVGQVRNISTQTTNTTYKLDDGTGIIEVKIWVDSDVDVEGMAAKRPVEQGYARVWGRLKEFGSRRHVGANVIRPVTDYNEVSFHLLEATAVHLHFTRGPLDQPQQANGGASHAVTNGGAQGQGQGQQAGGLGVQTAAMLGPMSAAAKKIYHTMRTTPQTQEGLHVQDIAGRVGLQVMDVQRACDELSNGGLVYTTLDESTFQLLQMD